MFKLVGGSGRIKGYGSKSTMWRTRIAELAPTLEWVDTSDSSHVDSHVDLVWADVSAPQAVDVALDAVTARLALVCNSNDEASLATVVHGATARRRRLESMAALEAGGSYTVAVVAAAGQDDRSDVATANELAIVRYERERLRDELNTAQRRMAQLLPAVKERDQLAASIETWRQNAETATAMSEYALARTRRIETENERLRAKLVGLEKQVIESKQDKIRATKELNARLQAEIKARKRMEQRAKALRRSYSYRLGNLFARAARSPHEALLLPLRVMRLLVSGYIQLQRRKHRGKPVVSPRPVEIASGLPDESKIAEAIAMDTAVVTKRVTPLRPWPVTDATLAMLLQGELPAATELPGPVIAAPLLASLLKPALTLHPNTWHPLLATLRRGAVVVDTHGYLEDTPWRGSLGGATLGYPGHLAALLAYCSGEGWATAMLLSDAAPGAIADTLSLFSHALAPRGKDLTAWLPVLQLGRTQIVRTCWPVAARSDLQRLNERRPARKGYLRIVDGAVWHVPAAGTAPVLIADAHTPIALSDAFAMPVEVPAGEANLRLIELVAKGAIPVGAMVANNTALAPYQSIHSSDPSRTVLELDEQTRIAIGRSNAIAGATHDGIERFWRDVADLSHAAISHTGKAGELTAVAFVERGEQLPLFVHMLQQQYLLPGALLILVGPNCNMDAVRESVRQKLPRIDRVDVQRREVSPWRQVGAMAAMLAAGDWCLVLDADCHYGADYIAHAAALATTGLADAYAHVDGAGRVDPATLVVAASATSHWTLALDAAATHTEPLRLEAIQPPYPITAEYHRIGSGTAKVAQA